MIANLPIYPAWIEIDLKGYARNLEIIKGAKHPNVGLAVVLKDNAYGHGAVELAKVAAEKGAEFLITSTLAEALELQAAGIKAKLLILGERHPAEFSPCIENEFRISVGTAEALELLNQTAAKMGQHCLAHLKIDSGMSRYGFRWSLADRLVPLLHKLEKVRVEGILSHFAMSDELDKTFALLQLERFTEAVKTLADGGIKPDYVHIANSGGLLDLPQAHFNLVRAGVLALGVYPSKVCRRLEGISPIMSIKARIAATKQLQPGDKVGYGMRFTASDRMIIATLPIGYGWGFPRVRNQGAVLIHGQRAPIIGGVSMDAISVDVTHIPQTKAWDEAIILGRSGAEEITIHEIAELKNTVSYDAMTAWRGRLPRMYLS